MSLITGKNKRGKSSKKGMARRPRGHEKIRMDKKRFGYFPQRFTWRGRRYDVHAVERCWTVSRKRLGNKVERLCFRVRCATVSGRGGRSGGAVLEGTFDLYQDLDTNTWYLEKVVSRA
jgi:hypothetical protein